ncbi:CD1375 family protein [Cytobacillus sp. IB215316]|nr:CD1375 family protein [Cytobacillus sp. IB215316]MDX8361636.1 CD1375 family protein [Cytobacillus sp. IB215316]
MMAKIYVSLINKGLRTVAEVPTRWRGEVQTLIDEANAVEE